MALHPDHVAALIDVRVAELRTLAAQTAIEFWRARPKLIMSSQLYCGMRLHHGYFPLSFSIAPACSICQAATLRRSFHELRPPLKRRISGRI
jgi:hypothetical protein